MITGSFVIWYFTDRRNFDKKKGFMVTQLHLIHRIKLNLKLKELNFMPMLIIKGIIIIVDLLGISWCPWAVKTPHAQ
jgi:hypothetical protein